MFLVLVNRTYRFHTAEGDLTVPHAAIPQRLPEWIKADPIFALAIGDGSLVEVKVEEPKAEPEPQSAPQPEIVAEPEAKSETEAKPDAKKKTK